MDSKAPLARFNTIENKINICVGRWAAIKTEKKIGRAARDFQMNKGYLPSVEKAGQALLSIALGYCILMSILGYFG
jgi:hypothetical protein